MKFSRDINLKLLEHFFKLSKVDYDPIQILSILEQLKRVQKNDSDLELILRVSEKFDLKIKSGFETSKEIFKKKNFEDFIFFDSQNYPFVLTKTFFNYYKIKNILTNQFFWIHRKTFFQNFPFQEEKIFTFSQIEKSIFHEVHSHTDHTYLDTLKSIIEIEKRDIWIMTIYSIAIGFLSLVIPIGIQSLVNILNFGTIFQPIIILTVLVILALSFAGVLSIMQFFLAELIQQRVFVRIASTISKRISLYQRDSFEKVHLPELSNYFLDISTIQKSLTLLLTDGMAIILQTVIGLLVLILYHPIFILFDLILIFSIWMIIRVLGQNGIETSIYESKAKYATESWMEEISQNKNSFRSKNSSEFAILKVEAHTKDYLKYRSKHYKVLFKQMIGFISIQAIGSGFLLGLGGYLVIKGEITLGQLVAAEIIVAKILDKFPKIGKYLESFYDLCASLDKINYLLDMDIEEKKKECFETNLKKPFHLQIQSLNHQKNETLILKNINLEIASGECVGIFGETNSGKTTLLEILYGLHIPTSGNIIFNTHRLSELDIFELRNDIAYMAKTEIFSGTILDAVRLGNFSLNYTEIREALERVGLGEKISELKDGLNTKIYRNHYPLKRDELYKLMFARTFLTNAGLIIIDDSLKNLEMNSKEKIISELIQEKKKSTILIAASNKEDLKFCDHIYSLQNGELKKMKGK